MNFERISSKSNDKIKRVSLLVRSSSARREYGMFVLEGLRLCRDAVLSGRRASELYFTEYALNKLTDDVQLLIDNSEKAYLVSDEAFLKLSDTENSQGIVSVFGIDSLPRSEIDPAGRYIACENVADPSNLGAISRTAEALGLSGMILIGHCCDRLNPKALRASMGAVLRLPVFAFTDCDDAVLKLHGSGIRIIASVVHGDCADIGDVNFKDGDTVVIGNEANGLSERLIELSDLKVTIPISGRAESFNASAAATVFMWELCRK